MYCNQFASLRGMLTSLALVLILGFLASPATAGTNVFDDLIRGITGVADDVPLRQTDELVEQLAKSKAARGAVDAELKRAGVVFDKVDGVARATARTREVTKLLSRATNNLDPSVMRRLEQMNESARETAFVLAKGGEHLRQTLPDLTSRGRFLKNGGVETVAAIGVHGPDVARAAIRVDEAIRGGGITVRSGQRTVTLADFGRAMTKYGDGSWSFWTTYVQPHWKVWAASGAAAAYLIAPEQFQDATGRLTEAGFKRLTEFVGTVTAAAIRGTGQGSGTAVEQVRAAVVETYFSGWSGVSAMIGTLLLFLFASLFFKRTRYFFKLPFVWLNRAPSDPSATPNK